MPRTTRIVLACVFLVIAVVTTAFAGIPRDEPAAPVMADTYVAMGSSYASGPGITPVIDRGCLRSGRNYPHQVAAALNLDLIDVTCSGATTADILSRQQRLRRAHRSLPRQIDAVTASTKVVTVTIGGNDVDYVGRMNADSCHDATAAPLAGGEAIGQIVGRTCHTAADYERPARRSAPMRQVRNALIAIVKAVHARAPQAKVFLVQYLPVLNIDGTTCDTVPIAPHRVADLAYEYRRLVAATASAAARSGATVVNAPSGHRRCDGLPWVTGYRLGNPYAGGTVPYHPNLEGATGQAAAVIAAMRPVVTAERELSAR